MVAAPTFWNSLTDHVKTAELVKTFQSLLKTHLFSLLFDPCRVGELDFSCCVLNFIVNFLVLSR